MSFKSILKGEVFADATPVEQEVYAFIEKSEQELKLAFNHMHQPAGATNGGQFTSSNHADGSAKKPHELVISRGGSERWKGGVAMSRSSRYGESGSKAKVMTGSRISRAGKEAKKHVEELHGKGTDAKVRHSHALNIYSHKDDAGTKVHQAVHTMTHEKVGSRESSIHTGSARVPSEEKMMGILQAQKTGSSLTHFESTASGKAKDQAAKHVKLTYGTKEFKNLESIQTALEQGGLDKTLVSKSSDGKGWEVHAPIGNGTKAGRAMQSRLAQFYTMHTPSSSPEHYNGAKTVTSVSKGKQLADAFATAHPEHALSKHWNAMKAGSSTTA
jgi:hypothetical protein